MALWASAFVTLLYLFIVSRPLLDAQIPFFQCLLLAVLLHATVIAAAAGRAVLIYRGLPKLAGIAIQALPVVLFPVFAYLLLMAFEGQFAQRYRLWLWANPVMPLILWLWPPTLLLTYALHWMRRRAALP